jgi:hypothetical protein
MYNRERDLIPFNSLHNRYFDLPPKEIYFFFDEDLGKWVYELIDNMSLSLQTLNTQAGKLISISFPINLNYMLIHDHLRERFPDAAIYYYESKHDWVRDYEEGWL